MPTPGAHSPVTSMNGSPGAGRGSPSNNRLFSPSTRSPTAYYTNDARNKIRLCWVGCAGDREELLTTVIEVMTYAISLLVAWEWNKCFVGWFRIWTNKEVESEELDPKDIGYLLAYALLVTLILLIITRVLKQKVEFAEDLV